MLRIKILNETMHQRLFEIYHVYIDCEFLFEKKDDIMIF